MGAILRQIFLPEYRWKVVLMRFAMYGLAFSITVLILKGITVGDVAGSSALAFFILGVLFGIVNTFIRPIIQLLTLPFLFATFGIVILLINALVLWIVEAIAPELIEISSAGSLIIGGLLIGVFGVVFLNLFGATRPIVSDQPSTRPDTAETG